MLVDLHVSRAALGAPYAIAHDAAQAAEAAKHVSDALATELVAQAARV